MYIKRAPFLFLTTKRTVVDETFCSLRFLVNSRLSFPRVTNVFYEQYLTIVPEGLLNISVCLMPTFVVCCLLLGLDLISGLINLITIVMIIVDTVGVMTLWGIDYNAVALINLVTVRSEVTLSSFFLKV